MSGWLVGGGGGNEETKMKKEHDDEFRSVFHLCPSFTYVVSYIFMYVVVFRHVIHICMYIYRVVLAGGGCGISEGRRRKDTEKFRSFPMCCYLLSLNLF